MREKKGHDSIFCDGSCQNWIHRQCAGLSKASFTHCFKSNDPFFCPKCTIKNQSDDVATLKEAVSLFRKDVDRVQDNIAQIQLCDHPSLPFSNLAETSDVCLSPNPDSADPIKKSNQSHQSSSDPEYTRKSNLISSEFRSLPKVLNDRLVSDLKVISSACQSSRNLIPLSSLIGCHQLGKYNNNHSTPRRILAKFNSSIHVSIAMGNSLSRHTADKVIIKRNLSVEQRHINNLILKETRELINSGTDRKLIKIRIV